eukprot:1856946-Rhodomonas_salina.2
MLLPGRALPILKNPHAPGRSLPISYARATQCPLRFCAGNPRAARVCVFVKVLRTRCALSGTDARYFGTREKE